MKPTQPPRAFMELYCKQQGLLCCDYLMRETCPRTCGYARRYHPVERARYLEDNFNSEEEFKRTWLRE